MKNVLLGASIDGLGASRLPEVLADAGCRVTAVCHPRIAMAVSGCLTTHIPAGREPGDVSEALQRQVLDRPGFYQLAILTDEPLLRELAARPGPSAFTDIVPQLKSRSGIERLLSKVYFTMDAAECGIPVPESRVIWEPAHLAREASDGMPFVLKNEEGFNGSGVFVIRGAEDLARAQKTLTTGPLLRQAFIRGRIGATAVLFDHGRPACWFSYFLCRNWPHATSPASAIEICARPEMEEILERLGGMTGYDGLCGLDWALDEGTGRALLLEMNPRPTPGLHAAPHAGVSFPGAIADWMAGKKTIQRPAGAGGELYRLFPQNLFPAIRDHDAGEFMKTWADAPFRCPRLLLSLTRRVLTHHLPAALRRTRS